MKAAFIFLLVAAGWLASPAPALDPAPPTAKEIIRYLLASYDVSLNVDPSCNGVGSDFKDALIGDYVSGLLAAQIHGGKNWIETSAKPRKPSGNDDGLLWECSVVFRRQDGEEEWGWGVTFVVRAADRKVIRESFRCTGSG